MKKELLIRYIRNETTREEDLVVLDWISKNESNERYFIYLKNIWVSQNISNLKATENDFKEIKQLIRSKENRNFWFKKVLPYAASVVLLISIALNVFYINSTKGGFDGESTGIPALSGKIVEQKNTVYTEKGSKSILVLPDGSKVSMNSDSRITYPVNFSGDKREIEFSGEAYFDVVKDPERPMIISTNKNFKIEVLGTKFNLKAYDNDKDAQATLYSGVINIISKVDKGSGNVEEKITKMLPSESCVIKGNLEPVPSKLDFSDEKCAWKDGQLIFEATPISEAIKILERWHGTEFIVKDSTILDFTITARFRSESIIQIMEMLRYCALIDYKVNGNTVVLFKR